MSNTVRRRRLFILLVSLAGVIVVILLSMNGDREILAESPASVNQAESEGDVYRVAKPKEAPERPPLSQAELIHELQSGQFCYPHGNEAVIENPNDGDPETRIAEVEAQARKISQALQVSGDADHLFSAAAFSADPDMRTELLRKAIDAEPGRPLFRWLMANFCFDAKDAVSCELRPEIDQLLEIDSENSEVWVMSAVLRQRSGHAGRALAEFERASTVTQTNIYFAESVETFERSLAATGMSFPDRVDVAFGKAAAIALPSYSGRVDMCRELSAQNSRWAIACLRLGERSEAQDVTELGTAIGLALQKIALTHIDDAQKRSAVTARAEARRQLAQFDPSKIQETINWEYYIENSSRVFSEYMARLKTSGERSAWNYMRAESARLQALGWLSPCDELPPQ